MKIKSLAFGVTLTISAMVAHAQETQSQQLVEIPLDNMDAMTLMTDTMNQIYGTDTYWRKHQCWVVTEDDASVPDEEKAQFCMKPLAIHALMEANSNNPERLYIQTTGMQINPENAMNSDTTLQDIDDFITAHSASGAFGAFVLDAKANKMVSSNYASLYPLGYGNGPGDTLELVRISGNNEFAWLGDGGFVFQGIATTIPVLYLPVGETIKNIIGNIPGTQEDTQDFQYSYAVDPSKTENGFYVIQITEQHVENGKSRTFEAKYDPSKGSYWCTDGVCAQ